MAKIFSSVHYARTGKVCLHVSYVVGVFLFLSVLQSANAQIDFENLPRTTEVDVQFQNTDNVIFSRRDSGWGGGPSATRWIDNGDKPVVAEVGRSHSLPTATTVAEAFNNSDTGTTGTAVNNVSTNQNCSDTTGDDTPNVLDQAQVGCRFLTDDGVHPSNPREPVQALFIEYTQPTGAGDRGDTRYGRC